MSLGESHCKAGYRYGSVQTTGRYFTLVCPGGMPILSCGNHMRWNVHGYILYSQALNGHRCAQCLTHQGTGYVIDAKFPCRPQKIMVGYIAKQTLNTLAFGRNAELEELTVHFRAANPKRRE